MVETAHESPPEPLGENPFGPPAQPPLRIVHLMLWTGVVVTVSDALLGVSMNLCLRLAQ